MLFPTRTELRRILKYRRYSIMNTTANRNTAALTGIFTTNVLATVNPNNIKNGVLYLGYSVELGEGVLMKIAPDCVLFGPVKKPNIPKRKKEAKKERVNFLYNHSYYVIFMNDIKELPVTSLRHMMIQVFRTDECYNESISSLFTQYLLNKNRELYYTVKDKITALPQINQVKELEEKPQTNQTAPIDTDLFNSFMGIALGQTGLTESEVTEYVDYVTRYIQNKREEMSILKKKISEISEDISSKSSEFVLEIQKRKEIAEKRREEEARKAAEEEAKKKQEEINSVREFLSGASDDMIQYLKHQLGVEETKESDSLKGDINMKVRVVPSNNDDSWNFFAKHIREICDHSSLPNREILESLVKKSDGMTLKEIADAMGFNSIGRIVKINDLLRKMKFNKILGTRVRKSGYKIATNKESRANGAMTRKINLEIYNELTSEYIK